MVFFARCALALQLESNWNWVIHYYELTIIYLFLGELYLLGTLVNCRIREWHMHDLPYRQRLPNRSPGFCNATTSVLAVSSRFCGMNR